MHGISLGAAAVVVGFSLSNILRILDKVVFIFELIQAENYDRGDWKAVWPVFPISRPSSLLHPVVV